MAPGDTVAVAWEPQLARFIAAPLVESVNGWAAEPKDSSVVVGSTRFAMRPHCVLPSSIVSGRTYRAYYVRNRYDQVPQLLALTDS